MASTNRMTEAQQVAPKRLHRCRSCILLGKNDAEVTGFSQNARRRLDLSVLGKFNQEECVMKLASAIIERTSDQFEAEALPDDHPAVPQLSELFGDHTFFWTPMGLTLWSPESVAGRGCRRGK